MMKIVYVIFFYLNEYLRNIMVEFSVEFTQLIAAILLTIFIIFFIKSIAYKIIRCSFILMVFFIVFSIVYTAILNQDLDDCKQDNLECLFEKMDNQREIIETNTIKISELSFSLLKALVNNTVNYINDEDDF